MFFERNVLTTCCSEGAGEDHSASAFAADYIFTANLAGSESVHFGKLPNLHSICLKYASGWRESIPRAISECKSLVSLNVTESGLEDKDLAPIIDALRDLGTLAALNLSHNQVASDGVRAITDQLLLLKTPYSHSLIYLEIGFHALPHRCWARHLKRTAHY